MKILMVVAKKDFRDEELKIPYDYFLSKKITVDIASTSKGTCVGKDGMQIEADRSLDDVEVQEYFAILLVGGPGSKTLVDNIKLQDIVKDASKQKIVISAICYAPVILAHAGVLDGKKATVWNEDKLQEPILTHHGATYVDEEVVVDGLIVTGRDHEAALKFAEEVAKVAECEGCWIQ